MILDYNINDGNIEIRTHTYNISIHKSCMNMVSAIRKVVVYVYELKCPYGPAQRICFKYVHINKASNNKIELR